MRIKLVKPWLAHQPGAVLDSDPNEAEWLIETGRGVEFEEEARAEEAAENRAD